MTLLYRSRVPKCFPLHLFRSFLLIRHLQRFLLTDTETQSLSNIIVILDVYFISIRAVFFGVIVCVLLIVAYIRLGKSSDRCRIKKKAIM